MSHLKYITSTDDVMPNNVFTMNCGACEYTK